MYVCKAGHMSIRKVSSRGREHAQDGSGTVETYFFDIEKCKLCPLRDGCYKPGAATKSYSVSTRWNSHDDQMAFQETDEFKDLA